MSSHQCCWKLNVFFFSFFFYNKRLKLERSAQLNRVKCNQQNKLTTREQFNNIYLNDICILLNALFTFVSNRIGGVMVSVLPSSAVDDGF